MAAMKQLNFWPLIVFIHEKGRKLDVNYWTSLLVDGKWNNKRPKELALTLASILIKYPIRDICVLCFYYALLISSLADF